MSSCFSLFTESPVSLEIKFQSWPKTSPLSELTINEKPSRPRLRFGMSFSMNSPNNQLHPAEYRQPWDASNEYPHTHMTPTRLISRKTFHERNKRCFGVWIWFPKAIFLRHVRWRKQEKVGSANITEAVVAKLFIFRSIESRAQPWCHKKGKNRFFSYELAAIALISSHRGELEICEKWSASAH